VTEQSSQGVTVALTKVEFATTEIRARILSGMYSPGTFLRLRPLADELGLSVMPVRDAIQALSAEGLVSSENHRTARVTEISSSTILEIVSLRMWVQTHAVSVATPLHTDATLAEAAVALEACAEALAAADGAAFSERNRRFHEAIESPAGIPETTFIRQLWNRLWQVRRDKILFVRNPRQMQLAQSEHELILNAVADRDARRAMDELLAHREHALAAWRVILAPELGEQQPIRNDL
jgi:DNA-binding GntR family transcriptional regulator